MKKCTNPDCSETRIEEFQLIGFSKRRQSQCKKCLAEKAKERPKPKIRKVGKIDSDLANDYLLIKW